MRRWLQVICLMCVAGLAGCGGSAAPSPSQTTRPVASTSAAAAPSPTQAALSSAYAKVVAAVSSQSSVMVVRTDGGSTTGTATTTVRSTDTAATGTIKYVQIGGADVTVVHNVLYLTPDAQLASNCNCAAGSFVPGQCYEVTPASASALGLEPAAFLSNSPKQTAGWLRSHPMTMSGTGSQGGTATFSGAGGLTMTVDTSTDLPIRIAQPNVLTAAYSQWGTPLTITAPGHCIPD